MPQQYRSRFAAFLFAGVLAVSIPLVAADPPAAIAAADISSIQIDNFGKVNDTYYRGAQPQTRDYAALAKIGVKTIINLTSDDADPAEKGLVERAGLRYVQIPMTTDKAPTPAQLTEFFGIVTDQASQPVYVHCVGGKHRTGVMTAAYRMNFEGWTADRAFKEMKQYKFGADFLHPAFKSFVYKYQPEPKIAAAPGTIASTVAAN
jgi:tyrosine-protein phosphatase SIW14